MVKGKNRFLPS